jgi:hypothetical protein
MAPEGTDTDAAGKAGRAVMERAALGGATAFFPMLYMAGYPSGANL